MARERASIGANVLNIDLTDAAKAYGLSYVPKVVMMDPWDPDYKNSAYFYDVDRAIHVGAVVDGPNTTERNEQRFERAGVGYLDEDDAKRFIIAHELWHAKQLELLGSEAMQDETWREYLEEMLGVAEHGEEPLESDADKHAAQVYKLVKLS